MASRLYYSTLAVFLRLAVFNGTVVSFENRFCYCCLWRSHYISVSLGCNIIGKRLCWDRPWTRDIVGEAISSVVCLVLRARAACGWGITFRNFAGDNSFLDMAGCSVEKWCLLSVGVRHPWRPDGLLFLGNVGLSIVQGHPIADEDRSSLIEMSHACIFHSVS